MFQLRGRPLSSLRSMFPRYSLKTVIKILFISSLFLIYIMREEIGGEYRNLQRYLSPIYVPPTPEWLHTRMAVPHLPDLLSQTHTTPSNTNTCTIPVLDPWDPEILPYVTDVPTVVCDNTQKSLLYTRMDKLHLNMSAMEELGLRREQVECSYRYIRRDDSDHYTFLSEETLSEEVVKLSPEYNSVLATCWKVGGLNLLLRWVLGWKLYENILLYLPSKPAASKVKDQGRTKYSVVLLLFDAVSQLNFIRSFPKTKELMESLGGFLFTGHHKVGYNSWPNVLAILGGEVNPPPPEDLDLKEFYYVDDHYKLLLQEFGTKGWTTMHMEDFQVWATLAREGKYGFRNSPAHIDYRAAYWAMYKEKTRKLRNRIVGWGESYACLQELPIYTHQFRILEDFVTKPSGPVFSFFHLSEYTHNVPNMGTHYDPSLHKLIHDLYNKESLNNTFFFILSDHGFQHVDSPMTMTRQGKVENNLPVLMLLPPSSLAQDQPEMLKALKENARMLTSHQDLYRTLKEVMVLGTGEVDVEDKEGVLGSSLLHPIKPRHCQEAGVSAEYCSCSNGIVNLRTQGLDFLARALLQDLDTYLEPLHMCRSLTLDQVKEATMRTQGEQSKEGEVVLGMHLFVKPSPVQFQVTLYLNLNTLSLQSAHLVRLDWYSATSGCLPPSHSHLKPYCIC